MCIFLGSGIWWIWQRTKYSSSIIDSCCPKIHPLTCRLRTSHFIFPDAILPHYVSFSKLKRKWKRESFEKIAHFRWSKFIESKKFTPNYFGKTIYTHIVFVYLEGNPENNFLLNFLLISPPQFVTPRAHNLIKHVYRYQVLEQKMRCS